jgi:predicted outer membrane lipoprotein
MTVPPDILKAFIEGKLADQEASGVAAEITSDPDLAAYVEDQKAFQAALASPPLAWLRRIGERAARQGVSWIPAMAMAAGIVLGVLLAASFGIATDMRSEGGTLIAQGELAHVLNTALASDAEAVPLNRARVGASFWSKNGVFCRSFTTQNTAQGALAGIACRDRGAWHIVAMAANDAVESAGAPSALPVSVRAVMENLIVGEPLKEDAERQARSQGWRPH